ncbi:cellulase family glycosylhydrolase [Hymenobacter aerilatus]|uniref:Cellulase family glycosylhydrolase n=1 Tax=Hymenobacter aerilatus TaxID=2932251 RepID=A0A8T9SYS2_9BACT|nr:cellulase family glycosylhydrolase [Hymenobacter aerilatus]UOR06054.1 cellulase family glycosylhydrolase [Hymenobacter aerilatus]
MLLLFAHVSQGQQLLRAKGTAIIDERGREIVLKGVGLGGWLLQESYMLGTDTLDAQGRIKRAMRRTMSVSEVESFYKQYRNGFITKSDIDFIAAQGFNCVRLPMHYDLFLTSAQRHLREQALDQGSAVPAYVAALAKWYDADQLFTNPKELDGFRYIDDLLAWCKANKLYVVLDLHAAPGGQGADRNINDGIIPLDLWKRRDAKGRLLYQDVTVRLWQKLAARYRNESWVAMYDVLNEPHGMDTAHGMAGDNSEAQALYGRLITAIRAQGDKHLIMVEGNGYGNEYTNLTPDKLPTKYKTNLVYNAHRYWCTNDPTVGDANPNQINLIRNLVAFRERWKVPVWVGETGENSNEWLTAAAQALNERTIGWCHWNVKRVAGTTSLLNIRPYGSILTPEGRANLLRNIQFKHCEPNRDVLDALMRQPGTMATKAYVPLALPGTIAATHYDMGRVGTAYQDSLYQKTDYRRPDRWNLGGAGRNDGVDIGLAHDGNDTALAVQHMTAGEWLQYTVTVKQPGRYNVEARVANDGTVPAELQIHVADSLVATLPVPAGPSMNTWITLTTTTTMLPAGQHMLRVYVAKPGARLNWLQFSPAATTQSGQ